MAVVDHHVSDSHPGTKAGGDRRRDWSGVVDNAERSRWKRCSRCSRSPMSAGRWWMRSWGHAGGCDCRDLTAQMDGGASAQRPRWTGSRRGRSDLIEMMIAHGPGEGHGRGKPDAAAVDRRADAAYPGRDFRGPSRKRCRNCAPTSPRSAGRSRNLAFAGADAQAARSRRRSDPMALSRRTGQRFQGSIWPGFRRCDDWPVAGFDVRADHFHGGAIRACAKRFQRSGKRTGHSCQSEVAKRWRRLWALEERQWPTAGGAVGRADRRR